MEYMTRTTGQAFPRTLQHLDPLLELMHWLLVVGNMFFWRPFGVGVMMLAFG
jgi:hypothetical protein